MGFKQYLADSGFNKPELVDGLRIKSAKYPDRRIYISSSPRFHNSFIYEFKLPGLDRKSIFGFNNTYLDYQFNSPGWYDYTDVYDLIKIFGIIKDIHDSWFNDLFVRDDISDFVDHVNAVRDLNCGQFEKYSNDEKGRYIQKVYYENIEKMKALKNTKNTSWADAMTEKYTIRK